MDPIIGGALIGTGMNLIGGILGNTAQSSANAANLQIARENRDWQESMWNKQNEYNSPAAQIQRMKEAGLNPALMYSQGNPGNAVNPPGSPATPTMQPLTGIPGAIGDTGDMIYKAMVQNEQVKQMRAQTNFLNARTQSVMNTTPEREWFEKFFNARTKNLTTSTDYLDSRAVGQDIYNRFAFQLHSSTIALQDKQRTKMNFDMMVGAADLKLRQIMTDSRIKLNNAQINYYNATVNHIAKKVDLMDMLSPEQYNLLLEEIANTAAQTDATKRSQDRMDDELILKKIDRVLKFTDMMMPDVIPMPM